MSKMGEKYSSKKAKMKHEKGESKMERKMEYGSSSAGLFGPKKKVAKKTTKKKMGSK
jgi:hypothetical protein